MRSLRFFTILAPVQLYFPMYLANRPEIRFFNNTGMVSALLQSSCAAISVCKLCVAKRNSSTSFCTGIRFLWALSADVHVCHQAIGQYPGISSTGIFFQKFGIYFAGLHHPCNLFCCFPSALHDGENPLQLLVRFLPC